MKSLFRPTFSLLLTLSMLLSSAGVALSEQLCLLTGAKTLVSPQQSDDCCPEPEAGKTSCCTKILSFEKLEPVTNQVVFQLDVPLFVATTPDAPPLFRIQLPLQDKRLLTYSDKSPPRYGRHLLHQLHTLLV